MSDVVYQDALIIIKKSVIDSYGTFAANNIPKGTRIIEYIGEEITPEEADRRENEMINYAKKNNTSVSTYIFVLNENVNIEGDIPNNYAKYINHSCEPNCEYRISDDKIWIYSIRDIKEGEELTYNYDFSLDEHFRMHPCRCGSHSCVGYILSEEEWPNLNDALNKPSENDKLLK